MLSQDLTPGHRLWPRPRWPRQDVHQVVADRVRNGYRQFDVRPEAGPHSDIPFWLTFSRVRNGFRFSPPNAPTPAPPVT